MFSTIVCEKFHFRSKTCSLSMTTLFTPEDELTLMRKERLFELEFYPLLDAVYAFAKRLTNDANRAEDLAQETFMKAWRSLDSYTAGTNAKAWLFRICKHLFINQYRSAARKPREVDLEDHVVFHGEDDAVSTNYQGLQEELGDLQLGDEILAALESLSPSFREVLVYDLDDFSYEEIATLINVPIGTVRSRLHRARNQMAEKLRDYARNYGYGAQDNDTTTPSETATSVEGNQGEVAAPSASTISK